MKKGSVLRTLRFVIFSIVLFVLIFSAVVITVLNIYVPKYLAKIGEQEVGYFSSPAEFDEVYEKLIEEKKADGLEVKVYLTDEPTFDLAYVRDGVLEEQNQYTNLRAFVKTEYTIYNVAVKDNVEMTFASKNEAEEYAKKIKDNIKSSISVEVKTEIVNELATMTDSETAKNTYNTLVSRYKEVVRVYTYVYSSNLVYQKATGALSDILSGGQMPTKGGSVIITQQFGYTSFNPRHYGIDIASLGSGAINIYPFKPGIVVAVGWNDSYGYYVKINHGVTEDGTKVETMYAHLCRQSPCSVNQEVNYDTLIGNMGMTGSATGVHLHFEIRTIVNGSTSYNNPQLYL